MYFTKFFSLTKRLVSFRVVPTFFPYDSQISGTSWGGMKWLLRNFSLLRKGWFYLVSARTGRKKMPTKFLPIQKSPGSTKKKFFFHPRKKFFFSCFDLHKILPSLESENFFFRGSFFFWRRKFFFSGHFCLCRKVPLRCPGKKISPIGTGLPTTNFLPYDSQISGTSWGGMKCILRNFSLL